MVKKKILFICKYNVLRSKIAEAYLKKINSNVEVKSAGIISKGNPLYDNEKKLIKDEGLELSKDQNFLSRYLIDWADEIIIVANDIPKKVLNRTKPKPNQTIKVWKVKDSFAGASDNQVKKIITDITSKIDKEFGGKK